MGVNLFAKRNTRKGTNKQDDAKALTLHDTNFNLPFVPAERQPCMQLSCRIQLVLRFISLIKYIFIVPVVTLSSPSIIGARGSAILATSVLYNKYCRLFSSGICFSFPEREGQWNGPFSFVQSADTQFGFIDLIAGKKGKDIT